MIRSMCRHIARIRMEQAGVKLKPGVFQRKWRQFAPKKRRKE